MINEIYEAVSEIPTDAPVICVDLDGTLIAYDEWKGVTEFGDPLPGAKEFLEALQEIGHVVIYTTRTNARVQEEMTEEELVRLVADFLDRNDLPYNDIYSGEGKPLAAVYIDDRSVECTPQNGDAESEYNQVLSSVKQQIETQQNG